MVLMWAPEDQCTCGYWECCTMLDAYVHVLTRLWCHSDFTNGGGPVAHAVFGTRAQNGRPVISI